MHNSRSSWTSALYPSSNNQPSSSSSCKRADLWLHRSLSAQKSGGLSQGRPTTSNSGLLYLRGSSGASRTTRRSPVRSYHKRVCENRPTYNSTRTRFIGYAFGTGDCYGGSGSHARRGRSSNSFHQNGRGNMGSCCCALGNSYRSRCGRLWRLLGM